MPRTTPLVKFIFKYDSLGCDITRVPINLIGSKGRKTGIINGVLDSGADEITIPKDLAEWLELDLILRDKPIHTAMGEKKAYSANIDFILFRGGKSREVYYKNIEICVIEGCPDILVGIEPVFKDYNIIIKAYKKKVIFEPPKE